MKKLSDYAVRVEEEILKLGLDTRQPAELYSPVYYTLEGRGKRLRPGLVLMAAEAFGANGDEALRAAVGMEMFHNFTLLHDDVMDKSDTRRGRPTVHVKWNENVAILSGDTMLTIATRLVSEVPDAVLRTVLDAFNDMALQVYEGQALDMQFENGTEVTLDDYLVMVGKKTGALLGCSAKIGALIAGADAKTADHMYDFGMNLGIAFQMRDDFLDVFGQESTFGKPIGGDINNGKQTFLLLKALEMNNEDSKALRIAMQLPVGEQRVKTVKNIFAKMNIEEICEKEILSYSRKALKGLKKAGVPEESYEAFHYLTEKMTGRLK